jgi:phytoene dehydrogenase-like protein
MYFVCCADTSQPILVVLIVVVDIVRRCQYRYDGGTGVLVDRIVTSLRQRGAQIYYKHRATKFQQAKDRVTITVVCGMPIYSLAHTSCMLY